MCLQGIEEVVLESKRQSVLVRLEELPQYLRVSSGEATRLFVDFGLKLGGADLMSIPGLYRFVQELLTLAFLGGSNVESLAKAAKLSHPHGYDEINLNCGCLSPKVTFIEALDQLMPGFDPKISKLAQRITPAKDGRPVMIELIDAKTKEPKDTLEVDAALIAIGRAPFTNGLGLENINVATQRGFIPVDERMRVIDGNGKLVPQLYCIGDANGKMMLARKPFPEGVLLKQWRWMLPQSYQCKRVHIQSDI
ncbi:unnamed protein product [Microthlaspi erraticum]|uniref:FAD/NAD(P)-binding domain-containing protein n=1 Tax=Microthlaspi erraticum TaxID=1685480 RepID=A0A6D2HG61_9BRAS|nr:unnamed protein product [Microthlaspi erraticum]